MERHHGRSSCGVSGVYYGSNPFNDIMTLRDPSFARTLFKKLEFQSIVTDDVWTQHFET